MRKLLTTLHLYAALVTGVVLALLGATGSIMAFEEELDHAFHAELFYVAPQGQARPLAELGAAAATTRPGQRISGYRLSTAPDLSYQVVFPGGDVFVNQYTGDVLGVRQGRTFLFYVHQLHLRLLAGEAGNRVVSWVGMATLFLFFSGLYLWWPIKRVSIHWRGSSRRRWLDIHNAAGVVSLVPLLVLTVTGVMIGFDAVTGPWMYQVTGTQSLPNAISATPHPGVQPITPDQAVEIARAALPGALPISVNVPGPKTAYRVASRYPEDLTPGGRSRIFVDPYSGDVRLAESSRTTAAGTRLKNANRAWHTGDIFGMPSKAIMSLASLMLALQVVSGVMSWWKRTMGKRREANGPARP